MINETDAESSSYLLINLRVIGVVPKLESATHARFEVEVE